MAAVDKSAQVEEVLARTKTESGKTLLRLTEESPVLLVFLRHFGCTFCRETIAKVAELTPELERRGVRPVFVHLGTPEVAQAHFAHYGMPEVERVHDPEARLYRDPVFGLGTSSPFGQAFRLKVMMRWLGGAAFRYGAGGLQNGAEQMPGVFFLRGPEIVRRFVHRSIADQPDYLRLAAV